jgi:hypothetical protein
MRPKIAMWSDYGAPRRKHWRARSHRSPRSSIGQRVLETAPESVGMIHEPQPPSPARPWVAQLIGDSSETAALSRFHQMQGRLQSALGGYEPAILRTTIKPGAAPIWVRVRIEFDTRQGADSLCAKLQAAREPCLVQRNFDNGISGKSASN